MTVGQLKKILENLPDSMEITNTYCNSGTVLKQLRASVEYIRKYKPCVERNFPDSETVQVLIIS